MQLSTGLRGLMVFGAAYDITFNLAQTLWCEEC